MANRTLPFILTMTLIFVGLVILQSFLFKPKIPDIANQQQEAGQQEGTKDENNELATGDKDETANQDDLDQDTSDADKTGAAQQQPPVQGPQYPRQFVTLLNQHLRVCVDSLGATVRRVELIAKKPNGKLLYRDVEYQQAFAGELELETVDNGCRVRSVPLATPASTAGIQVGDVITRINDVPVISPGDFEATLEKFDPGTTLKFSLERNVGSTVQSLDVEIATERSPMQVIRPTPEDLLRPQDRKRRAFQLTLKQQQSGAWPDLDQNMRFANWKTEILDEGKTVEFSYELPASAERGPLLVIKRYRIADDSDATHTFDRHFHVDMEFEFRNLGTQPQTVNYELVGPTGLPLEGWWYLQKIHGGTWAIGRMAGARDVVSGSDALPFKFTAGPQVVTDDLNNVLSPIVKKGAAEDAKSIHYMCGDTQYFASALLPAELPYSCYSAYAITASEMSEVKRRRLRTTDISFVIYSQPVDLQPFDQSNPATAYTVEFEIFAGPKEPLLLSHYGLSDIRTFGWFALFSKPLIWLLDVFYNMTFGWSYGLAIILLTVLVRSCMIPISRKAALNAQMMQHLQPEIKQIADKYKDDMEKRAQAQRELFAKYNYNPFGGCLLMFLQLPIFIGLYRGLSVDIALRDQPFIPGLGWCSNLAGPDKLFNWQSWMPGWLGDETGFLGPYFNLLPIATIVLFLMQQKLFMPPATDDQQKFAQRMMTFMMIFMGFIFFKVPSGLCVYFITSSIWGIIERKMLPKPQLDTSKFESGGNSKPSKKATTKAEPVALPMRNEKEIELRRRRDRERKKKLKDRK